MMDCPVCDTKLAAGIKGWHLICPACGYEASTLKPAINSGPTLDESAREIGLKEVRQLNFRTLIAAVFSIKPSGELLDVGCAHGWFLEVAQTRYKVTGIEPDQQIQSIASAKGFDARQGYFPQAVRLEERFDIISFNDVFEHIPNCVDILKSCYELLNDNGLLLINLPSSNGIFYRLSKLLPGKFFERLWQKDMPSPHVHYFNPTNLKDLVSRNGFLVLREGHLPTITLSGLYGRISYGSPKSHMKNAILYVLIVAALPVLRLFHSDIIYIIARKR